MSDWFERSVKPMSAEDIRYFFCEKTNLLKGCSPAQLLFLRSLYPELVPVRAEARSAGTDNRRRERSCNNGD